MMVKLSTVAELINAAIGAEDAARKIYLGFTYRFSSQPEVADFWQTMADDEAVHGRILSELRSHLLSDQLSAPIDARLAEKACELGKLNVQELVNAVRNLDDAYCIAYELESSEVNTVFNFLTIRYLPTEESHDIISATIDRHLLRLADFSRRFGDASSLRRVTVSA